MAKPKRDQSSQKSKEELRREQRAALEEKKHRQRALSLIGLIVIVMIVLAVLSVTVFFKVSVVEVDASKTQYSADQIRQAGGIETGDALFLVDREAVRSKISEQLPYTGEITVKRSLPGKVKIRVLDSSIKAAVRYNDQFYVLNEDNKVLAKVGSVDSLNDLVEKQAAKAQALQKKKKPSAAKASNKKTDRSTTTATTGLEVNTTVDVNAETSETTVTTFSGNIAGGEDLDRATDKVTIIKGVRVKQARVGHKLTAGNEEVFQTYNDIMAAMHRYGIDDITLADLSKVSDIRLRYQHRIDILLGSASGLDRKAALCAKVLEEQNKVSTEQKGSIDLSIDGKAYFSEGGATTMTTTTTTMTVSEDVTALTDPNDPSASVSQTTAADGTTGTSGTTTGPDPSSTTTATTQDPADIGG